MFRGFRIGIILTAFLCIAGMTFSYAASYVPYSKTKSAQLTASVNVRTDATTSAKSLGVLSKGTSKTVYGYKNGAGGVKWYKVYYNSSKQGYIHSKYVSVKSTDPFIRYYSSFKGTVSGSSVNVRSGASTSSSKVGSFKKGTVLTVIGYLKDNKGNIWYAFKSNGKTRFISASYVKKNSTAASTSKATAYEAYDVPKLASSHGANVRASASLSGSIKGFLKKNNKTSIFGYQKDSAGNTWYRVSYDGGYGYISKSCLTVLSDTYIAYSPAKSATVTDTLNIRTKASSSSTKAGSYAKGASVSLLGYAYDKNKTTWYAVKYNSKTCFICGTYVTTKAAAVTVTYPQPKIYAATGNGVNVRASAGTSSTVKGKLNSGTRVFVFGTTTDSAGSLWYKIQYNGGKAYVSSSLLNATGERYIPYASTTWGNILVDLNVRAEASADSTYCGYYLAGTPKQLLGYAYDSGSRLWYAIKDESGVQRFVRALSSYITTNPIKAYELATVTGSTVNIRSGAGTGNSIIGTAEKGDIYVYTGLTNGWYKIKYNGGTGYISSSYCKLETVYREVDNKFYSDLALFPADYRDALEALHIAYPNWIFKPVNTGLAWSTVISKESKVGVNVVAGSSPASYKSMEKGAYNWSSGKYVTWDSGGWVSADQRVIKYYMDPRNFLDASGIYQFLDNRFSSSNTVDSVRKVTKGTFMDDSKFTFAKSTGYTHYSDAIYGICKKIGVNPDVIASMIIQEQGAGGNSRSIMGIGTSSGSYKGYYNFLNIGAWRTSTMDAVTRGLWYAKQQGWNTRVKSITGGAQNYYNNYTKSGQYTLYFKKFNTANGSANVATHQYMSNVQGASGEANNLKKAFSGATDAKLTFAIPVYTGMPAAKCLLPPSTGNNNNFMTSLALWKSGATSAAWTKSLSGNTRYTTTWDTGKSFSVGTKVYVGGDRSTSSAAISGRKVIKTVVKGTNQIKLTLTSTSGLKRTYTVKFTGK